jgi:hypothetical protein
MAETLMFDDSMASQDTELSHTAGESSLRSLMELIREDSVEGCDERLRSSGLSFERLVSLVCH